MNYSHLYAIRAQEAVDTGSVRFEALVDQLLADGVPAERINEMLTEDLETGGPIFGKFFRDLGMAGDMTISTAEQQGSSAAEAASLDDDIRAFIEESERDGRSAAELLREGDPEALEQVEILADDQELTWIATMRNTCSQCLPLHGKSLPRREWRERGLRPRGMHPNCECDFVPTELAADRSDLLAPLKRAIVPGQVKGGRRTQRAVTQADVDAALAARDAAEKTPEGRKILRLLGRAREDT